MSSPFVDLADEAPEPDWASRPLGPTVVRRADSGDVGGPWQHRSLIVNFARRDLRARFKGTAFGVAWSLLLPIATLVIYSIVFGVIFQGDPPPLGNGESSPFFVFLFSGLVPWGMFAITLGTSIASLIGNGPLMKKIYFPAYASVLGSVLATFYQSLIELVILLVAFLVLGNVGLAWLLVPVWVAIFAVFVSSVSMALSILNVHYRDTAHIVSIVIQLQFYMTPIIYPISLVEGHEWHGIALVDLVRYQPLAAFVEVFRSLTYALEVGPARAWLTAIAWTLVVGALASWVYRRKGLDLSEEL